MGELAKVIKRAMIACENSGHSIPDIQAGVITNEEFAIFQNAGYMGLYGGLDVEGILAAVYQSVFGGDVYLSLEEKVANLLFNEIGNSQVV